MSETHEQPAEQPAEVIIVDAPEVAGPGVTENVLSDPHHERADMVMIRRAIRNDWPITDAMRRRLVRRMDRISSTSPDERNAVGAAKVLLAADALNAKREALDQSDDHKKQPDLHLHAHQHQHQEVRVIRTNDFFRNNAHDMAAESPATSDSNPH